MRWNLLLMASLLLGLTATADAAPAPTGIGVGVVSDVGFGFCVASPAEALQFINGTCIGGWISAP